MEKFKVLSVDYYNDFKCIGNQCEDHCCKDWMITVDKKTYSKYKKLAVSDFTRKLNDNINRNRKSKNYSDYAKINLVEGKCPMFSKQGLCEVYQNLGPENMCQTCKIYPRIVNQVDDVIEKSLNISCIEVAKNILLRKEPIEFNLDMEIIEDKKIVNYTNTNKGKSTSERYFNEIREFTIDIIQNRRFTIENRLAILGLFINKINSNSTEEDIVEKTIEEYNLNIDNGSYDKLLEELMGEEKVDAQLEFLTSIYNIIINKKIRNKRYLNNFNNIVESLQLDSKDTDGIKGCYMKALNNNYRTFMKDHEYIYENYLVNYIFKTLFPSSENSLLDAYINVIVQFSILKMNLIGVCGYYKDEMDTDKVINLIQSYAVVTEHNEFLLKDIHNYLKESNLNTLAHMFIIMGK